MTRPFVCWSQWWGLKWALCRHPCLLAGFGEHGLRFGLASAELAVADRAAGASGDCIGLWQLQQAVAVSNVAVLDAVMSLVPADRPGTASGGLLLSAALSPLHLKLSGEQAASAAACVGSAAAEASVGFAAPLLLEPPVCLEQGQQEGPPAAWLASASLSISSGLQLAYASDGGLHAWRGGHGSAALGGVPCAHNDGHGSAGSTPPKLFLALGAVSATLASSPADASAAGRAPGDQPYSQVLVQLELLRVQAWVLPQLAVHLPAAEVRLGRAAQPGSPGMLPEPLLLLAALSYTQQLEEGRQCEGSEQAKLLRRQRRSVQLASLSLAVSPPDFALALQLLRCWQQQPALPSLPAQRTAELQQQEAEMPQHQQEGEGEQQQQQQQADQQQQQVGAAGQRGPPGGATPADQRTTEEESELSVQVHAASITVWPQAAPEQRQPQGRGVLQQPRLGMAVWLSSLRVHRRERAQWVVGRGSGSRCADGSGSTEASLGGVHASLLRPAQPGGEVLFSPVLSFPDATAAGPQPLQQRQREQPALSLVLSSSWCVTGGRSGGVSPSPGRGAASGGRRLQLHVAPVSAALSRELMAALDEVQADLLSTRPARGSKPQQTVATSPANSSGTSLPSSDASGGLAGGSLEALQGKVALEGLRLVLLEAASWEQRQAEAGQQPPSDVSAAAGWHPAPGTAAVAVTLEEAVVLLQQAPVAENRPWLAGSQAAAGAVLTSADASLIGAAITVWHAGKGAIAGGLAILVRCSFGSGCRCSSRPVGLVPAAVVHQLTHRPCCCALVVLFAMQASLVQTPLQCCRRPMAACSCCSSPTRARWRWPCTRSCCRCRCPSQPWTPSLPPSLLSSARSHQRGRRQPSSRRRISQTAAPCRQDALSRHAQRRSHRRSWLRRPPSSLKTPLLPCRRAGTTM